MFQRYHITSQKANLLNMGMIILCAALFIIPLCGPLNIIPIFCIKDLWQTKEALSLLAIVVICMTPSQARTHVVNPWLKAMLAFMILAAFLIPPVKLQLDAIDLGGSWVFKSMMWVFAYFMLYRKIVSFSLNDDQKRMIGKTIGWVALISAIYAIVQSLNIDQFQVLRSYREIGQKTAGDVTAMIGSPVYLAVWLCICLPFSVIYMKWWQTALICIGIIVCQSDTGTVGMGVTLVLMACMRARSAVWIKGLAGASILFLGLIFAFWHQIRPHIHDNGRFHVWRETFEDWKSPAIFVPVTADMPEAKKSETELMNKRVWSLTGRGSGSFEFFYPRKHPSSTNYGDLMVWNDPHNVYLRVLYELGLIGIGIFLGMIGFTFWKTFLLARNDIWTMTIFCSFFYCCFAGLTTPIFTVEPVRFYIAVIFSLLSQCRPMKV